MLFDYANAAVFVVLAIGFVLGQLLLSRLVAPHSPSREKAVPYECGEIPTGTPWIRFNPRYFAFALIFLIFDVEIAFMYPCAAIFREWVSKDLGWFAFWEISLFVGFLVIGLVYVWKKGYLEWIRNVDQFEMEKNEIRRNRPTAG